MVVRYPIYFSQFCCAAGACPDTCCQGWDISIDKATLVRYKKIPGRRGKEIRRGVDLKRGCLVFENGVCPFLDVSCLCSLQKEGGIQMLPKACRLYPRHAEEYGSRREWSLSFSCPEAVRLILNRREPISFVEKTLKDSGEADPETDPAFLELLMEIRRIAIEIGQDRTHPLENRMAAVLALARDIQGRLLRGRDPDSLDEVRVYLERFTRRPGTAEKKFKDRCRSLRKSEKERENLLLKYRDTFYEFAVIEKKWKRILGRLRRWEAEGRRGGSKEKGKNFRLAFEHILVSCLDLYIPGAVYDGDLLSKVKSAVYHCIALRMLEEVLGAPAETFLHIYAREIEHAAENLEHLERMLRTRTEFTVEAMIACILPPEEYAK